MMSVCERIFGICSKIPSYLLCLPRRFPMAALKGLFYPPVVVVLVGTNVLVGAVVAVEAVVGAVVAVGSVVATVVAVGVAVGVVDVEVIVGVNVVPTTTWT